MKAKAAISSGLLVLALLLLSACGGGSGEARVSKAVVINRGDAICKQTDEEQNTALFAYTAKHPKAVASKSGQEEIVVVVAMPTVEKEAEKLAELSPPEENEEEFDAIVEGIESAVEEAEEDPGAIISGGKATSPFTDVNAKAKAFGFKACSDVL